MQRILGYVRPRRIVVVRPAETGAEGASDRDRLQVEVLVFRCKFVSVMDEQEVTSHHEVTQTQVKEAVN